MANNFIDIDFKLLDRTGNDAIDKPFLDGNDVKLIVQGLTMRSLKIALEILDRAQAKVPVDTGFLKSTGKVVQVEDGFEVRYDADYAIYVHELVDNKHPNGGQAKFLEEAFYEVMSEVIGGGDV